MFVVALATMVAVLDGPSTAQSPSPPAPSSHAPGLAGHVPEQPRFKSGVDLVSLDVCARDPAGRFLADLTADDFLVLENGKLQRISFVMPSGAVSLTLPADRPRALSRRASASDRAPVNVARPSHQELML